MGTKIELYSMYMGMFAGAIIFTIIFPFANEMVMRFGSVSDKDKTGTYVGLMASSLMLGRTVSGPLWGYAIDNWGRKKVTQLSLLSAAILSVLFGISNSFLYATFIRFLIGFLTPIMLSSRTMLGDICKGQQMPSAMAGIVIAWSIGSISGSFLGGLLANKDSINTRLGWLFVEYPFLFVNLWPSAISLFAFILGYLYLKETLVKDQDSFVKYKSRNIKELLFNKNLFPLLALSFMTSYNSTGFTELVVLFFWAEKKSGGLEITTTQIGYITGGSTLILLVFQKAAYIRLLNQLGTLSLCKYSLIVFPFFTILMPLSSLIPNDYIKYMCVVFLYIVWFLLDFFVFTGMLVLSSNAVRQQELGQFNGLVMTVNCFGRMLSPATTGALFSYAIDSQIFFPLNYTCSFFLLIVAQLLGLFWVSKVDSSFEKRYEEAFSEIALSDYLSNNPD